MRSRFHPGQRASEREKNLTNDGRFEIQSRGEHGPIGFTRLDLLLGFPIRTRRHFPLLPIFPFPSPLRNSLLAPLCTRAIITLPNDLGEREKIGKKVSRPWLSSLSCHRSPVCSFLLTLLSWEPHVFWGVRVGLLLHTTSTFIWAVCCSIPSLFFLGLLFGFAHPPVNKVPTKVVVPLLAPALLFCPTYLWEPPRPRAPRTLKG